MSYCKEEGKDRIIFVTEEDQSKPSTIVLDEEPAAPGGLIQEDGGINWNCPCLGGMASGPCGVEFREAFGCFHNSDHEPKGGDCLEPFRTMSQCMAQFPGVYGSGDDNIMNINEDDDDEEANNKSSGSSKSEVSSPQVSTSTTSSTEKTVSVISDSKAAKS